MAEEPNNDVNEETQAEETPAAEAPAEETAPAAADDSAPAGAEPAEPAEVLSPTERRKRRRSQKIRRPKLTGTPEEKAQQRAKIRAKKAAQRRAYRLKQREAHKAAGPREGTPATVTEPGVKKTQQGTVVSSKNDKTIVVAIEVAEAHRIYKKVVRHTRKLTAHDATNDANEGDVVRVVESRPLSRTKRWRLVEVLERAK